MKPLKIPIKEFNFSFSRSSGSGGQNVNKVNSKVTLIWNLKLSSISFPGLIARFQEKYPRKMQHDGTVSITSQRFRNQGLNTADCIEKIEEMINSVAIAPKKRRPTKPKKGAIEKRLKNKKEQGDKKKRRQSKPDY